jgi:hypothetical protein
MNMSEAEPYAASRSIAHQGWHHQTQLLRCMSPFLAQSGPSGMSAIWSLSGAKRTTFAHFETFRL